MKKVGKPVFFIIAVIIILFTVFSVVGLYVQNGDVQRTIIKSANDIRWGIDIRGGVDATFMPVDDYDATDDEMRGAQASIEARLLAQNIADYEIYTDFSKNRIIVRFPWKAEESGFDPQAAIQELGETALLTFREGMERDSATGAPAGVTAETILLQGSDVESAKVMFQPNQETGQAEPVVTLTMSASGKSKFAEATTRLIGGTISIWMDDMMISAPTVQNSITDGEAVINGMQDVDAANDLADKINAGALPFALKTDSFSTISPQLGGSARDAMVLAGIIAFILIILILIIRYRLPGFIAAIALTGQVGIMIAAVTGFFPGSSSFTLTLPGIAGMILSIGFGVDANVITAERIKEEIRAGKSIDSSVSLGFSQAFSAILDGNVTNVIVAVILMGAFGPPSSAFVTILKPFFFMFGPSSAGSIYSFGFTLLVGVIANFIVSVFASKVMLKSISRQPALRKPWLYGGER